VLGRYFATYILRNGAKVGVISKIWEYRIKITYRSRTTQEVKPWKASQSMWKPKLCLLGAIYPLTVIM
jgi:hypothetical protein